VNGSIFASRSMFTLLQKLGKAATKDEDLAERLKKSVAQIAAAEIQIVPSSSAVNLA
jgi:hypothetical protein